MNSKGFTFLVLIGILLSCWSFKIYSTGCSGGYTKYSNYNLIRHRETLSNYISYLLDSDVCTLGKIGEWFIIIWSIVLITLALTSKKFFTLGILNSVFMSIIFILALVMNRPLFIRSIPFFIVQVFISLYLFEVI